MLTFKEFLAEGRFMFKAIKNTHFGLESKKNASKVDSAIRKAGFTLCAHEDMAACKDVNTFSSDTNFGTTYFYFKSKAALKRAEKIAMLVIDKSLESEWGGISEMSADQSGVQD